MVKPLAKPGKTLSETNLARLGQTRLAQLLMEAAEGNAALKRRLRYELVAEVSAADLAFELDKRLISLASSHARISWRKRPDLIKELRTLQRVIVDKLGTQDTPLGLVRLIMWFDLAPQLASRTKDPKNEVRRVFDEAVVDLALLSNGDVEMSLPLLTEALSTRSGSWNSLIAQTIPHFSLDLAQRLLQWLSRQILSGRTNLLARRLADRASDLPIWLSTLTADDWNSDLAAEAASRLALAGQASEAREALERARVVVPQARRWSRQVQTVVPSDAWRAAEVVVLDAEGETIAAMHARWTLFERTLSVNTLREIIGRLDDFDDVDAIDRATAYAVAHVDATRGLEFLMGWGALREAADMVVKRACDLNGRHEQATLWASRLAARYPIAALYLLRARARALVELGSGADPETTSVHHEAEALYRVISPNSMIESHEQFSASLGARP